MFILVIIYKVKYILDNCERNAQLTRLISVCFNNIIICAKDKIVLLNKRKLINVFVCYKSIESLSNILLIKIQKISINYLFTKDFINLY